MLEGYGLHTLIWDSADERLGDFLVASPADATGRGLELHVRQGGAADARASGGTWSGARPGSRAALIPGSGGRWPPSPSPSCECQRRLF